MKQHNFNEAIEIFKGMFEGWCLVTKTNERHELIGVDVFDNHVISTHQNFEFDDISHLEQNKPMNGDEVWAWDDDPRQKKKFIYIGKTKGNLHACFNKMNLLYVWGNVELISPTRKLTIKEATEMLKGIVTEPFEIIKE